MFLFTWDELRGQDERGQWPGGSSWPGYSHGHLTAQQQRLLSPLEQPGLLRLEPGRVQGKGIVQVDLSNKEREKMLQCEIQISEIRVRMKRL